MLNTNALQIYLYQKWAYPVDLSRTNEYGTSGVDPDGSALIAAAVGLWILKTKHRFNKYYLISIMNSL